MLDLGLARVRSEKDEGLEEGLTQAGQFVGTPDFAAPEQAEDPRKCDIRADLYSLGATWFFLLTAQLPYPGVTLMQKLRRQLSEPTPLVTDHAPDTPPVLAAIIRKLMDRAPNERFQTPTELADIIAAYLRDPSRVMIPGIGPPPRPLAINAHERGVQSLAISADGQLLLTGGDDEMLRLWDSKTGQRKGALNPQAGPLRAVAFCGADKRLALAGADLRLRQADGTILTLSGHTGPPLCVAFSANGALLASGSEDHTVRLWHAADGQEAGTFPVDEGQMVDNHHPATAALTAKQTLLWTWLPMLITFASQRLHLHLGGVRHVYPAGYLLHHLFTGALLVIVAAFILAFTPRRRLGAIFTRVVLGVGSAMVLDEVVYLVATGASDEDYVSATSLWGAVVFMSLATALLFALYWLHRNPGPTDAS